jgi:hypothetical protein
MNGETRRNGKGTSAYDNQRNPTEVEEEKKNEKKIYGGWS